MDAYYNEIDPKAAAWLRELIKQGHIAPGDVDERSIEDITPYEIKNYTQCHFFAGIGVWSHALRRAGWSDDRPVWTGSCPCQPFSAAGKGVGFADERHLFPAWHYLIEECCPDVVFGEQVASKDGLSWLDLVQTDMERTGYSGGGVDICAAGVGAPHIRQRLYFVYERVGNAFSARLERHPRNVDGTARWPVASGPTAKAGCSGGLADTDTVGRTQRRSSDTSKERDGASGNSATVRLANPQSLRRDVFHPKDVGQTHAQINAPSDPSDLPINGEQRPSGQPTGPTNGLWRDADWLYCRDGKWRPVEPSTFPLVDGSPARVGRLRGYGNALNAEVATIFIESYLGV
jgi:DNA (cytosine-5)-methyltransferase 1